MFAVFASVLLCVLSVSRSDALACGEWLQPLKEVDTHQLVGRWALVAGSMGGPAAEDILKGTDSITVDFYNSSYTQSNLVDGLCRYHPRNVSIEGHVLKIQVGSFNFTGALYNSSCPDCTLFTLDVDSQHYKQTDFYLFSRRRELKEEEMNEFKAQVECLNMPPPVVMNPNKELCPEQTDNKPAAQATENTEGQNA